MGSSFIWRKERVNPSSLHVADHREDDSAIGMRSVLNFEINFLATLAYPVATFANIPFTPGLVLTCSDAQNVQ